MEKDFFELYERQALLTLEVSHNSVSDWSVIICNKMGLPLGDSEQVVHAQEASRELAFASAFVALTEWLSDERGGY